MQWGVNAIHATVRGENQANCTPKGGGGGNEQRSV